MKIRQWEVWKAKPPGWQTDHWFVIISGQERCDSLQTFVNGLACHTLRGRASALAVILNQADDFSAPTEVVCDYLVAVPKSALHSGLGLISWERQQQIKSKIKELFRL